MTDGEAKQPLIVHCKECQHEQVAFYFPLLMDERGMNLMRRAGEMPCQMCGAFPMYIGRRQET